MSEWIKVSDRLPPTETPVLLLVDRTIYTGSLEWERPGFEDTFQAFQYFTDADERCDWEWADVTHWRPMLLLPEPIAESEDDVSIIAIMPGEPFFGFPLKAKDGF